LVKDNDQAKSVGDEALLLLQNTHCPLVICVDRVAAVRELLQRSNCNVVISDDGLQHYSLGRALEIVMVDGVRRFGNGRLLPAGPLRESTSRIHTADFVVVNGDEMENDEYTMSLEQLELVSVMNSQQRIQVSEFSGTTVHAIAGIGHPERFFRMLKNVGINLITHSFPDHHLYQARELDFSDVLNVIMTEKDAVKCGEWVDGRYWYLRITAKMNQKLEQTLLMKLKLLEASDQYETDFAIHSCDAARRFQRDNIR
jgi:tetraacyldisaccharide 4'-kinase